MHISVFIPTVQCFLTNFFLKDFLRVCSLGLQSACYPQGVLPEIIST